MRLMRRESSLLVSPSPVAKQWEKVAEGRMRALSWIRFSTKSPHPPCRAPSPILRTGEGEACEGLTAPKAAYAKALPFREAGRFSPAIIRFYVSRLIAVTGLPRLAMRSTAVSSGSCATCMK